MSKCINMALIDDSGLYINRISLKLTHDMLKFNMSKCENMKNKLQTIDNLNSMKISFSLENLKIPMKVKIRPSSAKNNSKSIKLLQKNKNDLSSSIGSFNEIKGGKMKINRQMNFPHSAAGASIFDQADSKLDSKNLKKQRPDIPIPIPKTGKRNKNETIGTITHANSNYNTDNMTLDLNKSKEIGYKNSKSTENEINKKFQFTQFTFNSSIMNRKLNSSIRLKSSDNNKDKEGIHVKDNQLKPSLAYKLNKSNLKAKMLNLNRTGFQQLKLNQSKKGEKIAPTHIEHNNTDTENSNDQNIKLPSVCNSFINEIINQKNNNNITLLSNFSITDISNNHSKIAQNNKSKYTNSKLNISNISVNNISTNNFLDENIFDSNQFYRNLKKKRNSSLILGTGTNTGIRDENSNPIKIHRNPNTPKLMKNHPSIKKLFQIV